MKTNEIMLTVKQAATIGRLPVGTVRAWIHDGRLDVVRQGNRVYVMRGTLERLLLAVCELCGTRFRKANQRARFCSTRCRQQANKLKNPANRQITG